MRGQSVIGGPASARVAGGERGLQHIGAVAAEHEGASQRIEARVASLSPADALARPASWSIGGQDLQEYRSSRS
jgi:hypothetical protein